MAGNVDSAAYGVTRGNGTRGKKKKGLGAVGRWIWRWKGFENGANCVRFFLE